MSRYYFDIDDGECVTRDELGRDCASRGELRDLAVGVLPSIARDVLHDVDQRDLVVKVRDASGRFVFQATLSLRTKWLAD